MLNIIKGLIAAVGGGVAYWLGGLDKLLTALLVLIIVDYITGIAKAVHNKALSSEVGFRGIAKKVLTLSVVALAFVLDQVTGGVLPLREVTIVFFIANEGLSILENAAGTGLPIPQKLMDALAQLKGRDGK